MSSRDRNTHKMYSKFSDVSSSRSAHSRSDMSDTKCAEKKDCTTDEFYDSGVISETCDNLYSEGDIRNDPSLSSSSIDVSSTDSKSDKQTKQDSCSYLDSGLDVMKSTTDMNVDSGFISEASIPCHSKSFESEKLKPVEPKQEKKVVQPSFPLEMFNYQDQNGNTILHYAVVSKHETAIKYIVFNSSSSDFLDTRNCNAQTCLHLAVLTNQPRIVRFLLLAGAKPGIEDSNGNTALHLACEMHNSNCVGALCDSLELSDRNYYRFKYIPKVVPPQDYINEINYDGLSCLHIATKSRQAYILKKLLKSGANINIKEHKGGQTVLHEAVSNGCTDLVELILSQRSVNVEQENYACHTAYQLSWSYPKISKMLLAKKALELDFVEYELEDSESSDDSDVDEEYSSHFRNDSSLNNFANARSEMVI